MYKVIALAILPFMLSIQSSEEWTVSTFNIRYDNPNDPLIWDERKEEVVKAVAYFDIVGFQEVLPNQLEDLKTKAIDQVMESGTPEELIKQLDNTTKKIGIAWVVDTSKIKQITQN